MSRILVPSPGAAAWRQFLAKPDRQWATGYSARTIAHAWEAQAGWPPEVGDILQRGFGPTELLLAIPERKTPLPGGRRESQSDVFALGRHSAGLIACTIEGKVSEPFGPTVADQMKEASPGKLERLDYLCRSLGLDECPGDVRYQLIHRTVCALIEADRFDAKSAAMIVHSFSAEKLGFEAYARFVAALGGAAPTAGEPTFVKVPAGRTLLLGWACGDPRYLIA